MEERVSGVHGRLFGDRLRVGKTVPGGAGRCILEQTMEPSCFRLASTNRMMELVIKFFQIRQKRSRVIRRRSQSAAADYTNHWVGYI
jgi:hypothetical protein